MTAAELKKIVFDVHYPVGLEAMAEHLGVRDYTLDFYVRDKQPIPKDVAAAARWIAAEYRRNPWARGEIGSKAKEIRREARPRRRKSVLRHPEKRPTIKSE